MNIVYYHYDLDEIEHDPYVLLAILSALHDGEWTLADVQGELQTIFDRQYILTETVVRETRYRTVHGTDAEGNPTQRRVPYSYYISTVTLENANLSHLPVYMMSTDQLSRYALYMASLGNRPDLFPTSEYPTMKIEMMGASLLSCGTNAGNSSENREHSLYELGNRVPHIV